MSDFQYFSGQTPCAFAQTTHIYTNPKAELEKAKDNANAAASQATTSASVLDLSGGRRKHDSPLAMTGGLNLKRESALKAPPSVNEMKANPMMDLSLKAAAAGGAFPGLGIPSAVQASPKNEVKVSPFSAEALLSKPRSSASASPKPKQQQQPLYGGLPQPPRLSEAGKPKSSTSSNPWHLPTSMTGSAAKTSLSSSAASKPAIPVSPVVREDAAALAAKKAAAELSSFQSALLGLGGPSSAAAAASAASGMPPVSMALPPSSFGLSAAAHQQSLAAAAAAANPYLAATAGLPKTSTATGVPASAGSASSAALTAAAAAANFPGAHLMDPATSAYYAALYSQSLYGAYGLGNPAAAAASLRPPPAPPSLPPAPPAPSSAGAAGSAAASLELLQLQALQAMMAGGGGGAPSAGSAHRAPAAGANPFAGYPGLGGGLPGYPPGFPPGRKD